jgi:hypothetical protein
MKTDELKKLVEDRDRILADIADFDGDRRGHYMALQSVDDQLGEMTLAREVIALREAAGELADAADRTAKTGSYWNEREDFRTALATLRAVRGESE